MIHILIDKIIFKLALKKQATTVKQIHVHVLNI